MQRSHECMRTRSGNAWYRCLWISRVCESVAGTKLLFCRRVHENYEDMLYAFALQSEWLSLGMNQGGTHRSGSQWQAALEIYTLSRGDAIGMTESNWERVNPSVAASNHQYCLGNSQVSLPDEVFFCTLEDIGLLAGSPPQIIRTCLNI